MPSVPPRFPSSPPSSSWRPPQLKPPSDLESGHRLLRFGALVGAGALSTLAATVPAAIRVADVPDAVDGVLQMWMAIAGAAVVPTILATAALRGARASLHAFTGAGWP